MTVRLLYFGVLKELFATERDILQVSSGCSVAKLLDLARNRAVLDSPVWGSLAVAVNREYAGLETILHDGDEVALLPPVSGGCR